MVLGMRALDAHGKLLTLLCLLLVTSGTLLLWGGGGGLLPQQAQASYDQVAESFDQIVPGMTRADDLPNLGFDPRSANADVLSYPGIQERFLPAAGVRREHLDPAVQACIRAELYCTGYVFHPAGRSTGTRIADLLGLGRGREPADMTLLLMNGRVIHKVFSVRSPQDGAVARAATSTVSF